MIAIENIYNKFVNDFTKELYEIKKEKDFSSIVFLCIGTDRITGDSYGPLVGHHLKKLFKLYGGYSNVKVFGDLEEQISNDNIKQKLKTIYNDFERPCVIAIDSALSKVQDIGSLIIDTNGICVGKAMNRKEERVGDLCIKGVVSKNLKSPRCNFNMLQNIPLGLVLHMSELTSNGIYEVMKYD